MNLVYCDGGVYGKNTKETQTYGSFSVNGYVQRLDFGIGSNNTGEYNALIAALKYCYENKLWSPRVYMDSELVVKQIRREYRVKDSRLRELWKEASALVDLTSAIIEWVPRNKIAAVLGH